MTTFLLAISIGPVQGFIASARRTRDLWFGSELLSEVAKAVALSLNEVESSDLIFPAPQSNDDLLPDSSFNVGNKLLIVVTDTRSEAMLKISNQAKKAAKDRWCELAEQSLKQIKTRHTNFQIREEVWNEQLGDVVEFFSAWTPLTEDYKASRQRVEQLLAARKNSRDFLPSTVNEMHSWGLPKSSLDGQRETVLPKDLKLWQKRKMGLNEGEQLDCPALVKRLGGQDDGSRFTPLSRIAIDSWLRGISNSNEVLSTIKQCLNDLVDDGLVTRVCGNQGHYEVLPFDGQLLYPSRIEAERKRLERERIKSGGHDDVTGVLDRLNVLENAINKADLYSGYNEPSPYLAVIAADGDHMGKLLDSIQDPAKHKEVSDKLSQFAAGVPEIVRGSDGHCIYAGGDDVLALVPLDRVIACARQLRNKFCEALSGYGNAPTLSVGIAVVHFIEPMGRALALARKAEALAKGNYLEDVEQQKDALAIILDPRSGAPIEYRARWPENPDGTLQQWVDAHVNDLIPDGAAYELREEAQAIQWALSNPKAKHLISKEVKRILSRKKPKQGQDEISKPLLDTLYLHAEEVGMSNLANELILTRRFADAHVQSMRGTQRKAMED